MRLCFVRYTRLETNVWLRAKYIGKATSLLGLNYFNYDQTIDHDKSGLPM
jgi:hypothetical protein